MTKCTTWDVIVSRQKKEEAEKRFRARQEALKKKNQEKQENVEEMGQ